MRQIILLLSVRGVSNIQKKLLVQISFLFFLVEDDDKVNRPELHSAVIAV